MRYFCDLTGQRYGRLTCISRLPTEDGPSRVKCVRWRCRCDCGNEVVVRSDDLRQKGRVSCGCAWKSLGGASVKHAREYGVWSAMMFRCFNDKCPQWHNYGGRGITVCERWRTFANFLADMGERQGDRKTATLDRINVNGNYEPANCRWATMSRQARNTRRTRMVEHEGRFRPVADWAEEAGIAASTLAARLDRGMPLLEAITKPPCHYDRVTLSDGTVTSVKEWAAKNNTKPRSLYARIKLGWSLDEAFTVPVRIYKRRHS